MSRKVLVDTSIWVEFFRGKNQKVKTHVSNLIKSQRACLTGVVMAELFHGVKTEQELEVVREAMEALDYFEAKRSTWEKTGKILRNLRLKGITLPLSDVLLATIAEENGCEVLTSDNHFEKLDRIILHQM